MSEIGKVLRAAIPPAFQPRRDVMRRLLAATGYFRARTWIGARGRTIPDAELYQPLYSPWLGISEFEAEYRAISTRTLVSRDRAYMLWQIVRQALELRGDVLECGVYKGGTALLLARAMARSSANGRLLLFDTFQGLPEASEGVDSLGEGGFNETSLDAVRALLSGYSFVSIRPGLIPDSFAGLDVERIAFAHVDLDLYQSIQGALAYIYPRMVPSGIIVLDDYGFPSCPGARRAVEEFFDDKPEVPFCLTTGQAMVVKLAP